ncbi:MAG: helix-hairpin-helix domain-containing protein [Paludibacteraceae bacterium]
MLKDFFYFNRAQRIGIMIMLTLIVLSFALFWLMPLFFKPETELTDKGFLKEAVQFRRNLAEIENAKRSNYEDFDNFYKPYADKTFENTKYELFAFDPNTADSAKFVRLGLKPYIAKNILKYRSKGGKFRKPDDFAKVYGISTKKFEELKPYISINEKNEVNSEQTLVTAKDLRTTEKTPPKINIILELNDADTASLMQIPGIGKTTAKGIVGYRRILGGYYSVEQLKEVYGMRPENFERIKQNFTVDASQIKRINVNVAGLDRLKSHPYIKTFQKAKVIYELRRKRLKLNSMNDLRVLNELTENDFIKLEPYLEFK